VTTKSRPTTIDTALMKLKDKDPQAVIPAIVRSAHPVEDRRAELKEAGLTVHHIYRLRHGAAVEGTVANVLALAEKDWVTALWLDREVRTTG
jgi:hypothetical protein